MIPAIYDRRSIRKFSSRPIDERDLLELMDSAARAPSSKNSQPWKYVIVTGNAKNEMLDAYRRSPGLPRGIPRAPAPQTFGGHPPLAALNFARTPPRPRPGPKPGRAGARLHPGLALLLSHTAVQKSPGPGHLPPSRGRPSTERITLRRPSGAVPFDFPGNPRTAAGPRQGFVSKRYNPDTTLCYCVTWNAVQTGKD